MKIELDNASPKPLYIQVKERIKDYILENDLQYGDKLSDIKTIARDAGVGVKTVYKGMEELILEGICFRSPKKGTFVGDAGKQTQKQRSCAVYCNDGIKAFEEDMIQMTVQRGMVYESAKKSAGLFYIFDLSTENIATYLSRDDITLDGVIIPYWQDPYAGVRLAEALPQLKVIYINYFFEGFEETPDNVYGIFNDDFAGAFQMTDCLCSRGHEKIAIFGLEMNDENYKRRIMGFKQAMDDQGMGQGRTVFCIKRDLKETLKETGFKMAEMFFADAKEVDAIFCLNDAITEGVASFLEKENVTNITLAGYDNLLPYLSRDNKFSTVAIDFEGMGKKAIDIIYRSNGHCPKIIRLTPQLIIR